MKWNVIPIEPSVLKDFALKFKVPEAAAQLFIRRGISKPEDVAFFLEDELKYTHNPFLFEEMEDVVERINQAVAEGEKILCFGDRDVDGITSLTILVSYLEELGADVRWRLPLEDDPYGLSIPVIEEFAADGGTLIITVDCGITAVKEVERAVDLGIDVLIVDHHNPPEEIPEAVGIINPKMPDSGYPFQGLSAAAITAKLVWALRFSRTEVFGQEFCLVNVRPANDSLCFEAIVVKNMVVVRRLTETLASNAGLLVQNRILPFIQGIPLLVYDWQSQKSHFESMFGTSEIYVLDMADDLWKRYPSLRGKSLVRILANSKTARYSSAHPEEIDGLFQVFGLIWGQKTEEVDLRYKESLGLVALSLVADMMPMVNENRVLMRLGMQTLSALPPRWFGLQSILVELDLARKPPQVRDIGWKIAPLINSSGRMGRPDLALKLLLAKDPSDCHTLLKELTGMNIERKRLGELAWKKLYPGIQASVIEHKNLFALIEDHDIPRGITGILAGRFSREFNASIIILAKVQDSYVGSIRTARGLRATWLLEHCSDILNDFGGHDAAGGFHLALENLQEFKERMSRVISSWVPELEDEDPVLIDIVCEGSDLDDSYWTIPGFFVPHGQQFEPPLFLVRNLQVRDVSHMGKDSRHLNLELEAKNRRWPGLIWDGADLYGKSFSTGDTVDLIASLEKNQFRSTVSNQLVIQEIVKKARSDA